MPDPKAKSSAALKSPVKKGKEEEKREEADVKAETMMAIVQQAITACREETKVQTKGYRTAQQEKEKKEQQEQQLLSARGDKASAVPETPAAKKGKKEDKEKKGVQASTDVSEVMPSWCEEYINGEMKKAAVVRRTHITRSQEQLTRAVDVMTKIIPSLYEQILSLADAASSQHQQQLSDTASPVLASLSTLLVQHQQQLKPSLAYQPSEVLTQLIVAEQQRRSEWKQARVNAYQQMKDSAERDAESFLLQIQHYTQCLCQMSEAWLMSLDVMTETEEQNSLQSIATPVDEKKKKAPVAAKEEEKAAKKQKSGGMAFSSNNESISITPS